MLVSVISCVLAQFYNKDDEVDENGRRKVYWWAHLMWPAIIVIVLFNIVWVNVFNKDPVGK